MVNFSALNLQKNQDIVVTTSNQKFIAKFNKLSLNGNRLDVVDVKDENGSPFSAFKYFYAKEGVTVTFEDLQKPPEAPAPSPSFLNDSQLTTINNSIATFILIQQPDAKYFEALDDISKQFVIGISADCSRGQIDNVSLLVISTGDKVYIFDLFSLNVEKTVEELKEILTSDAHLKIVHNARKLVSNFKSKFQVELKPTFDTMLAAAQFHESESVIGYRNIVKTVLGVDVEVEEFKGIVYRPLSQEILHSFAVKTAFLVAMYHKLASKGFSFAFGKYSADSMESKNLFSMLSLTDSEELHLQLQSSEIRDVDFSVYQNSAEV